MAKEAMEGAQTRKEIWQGDRLGRRNEADFLGHLLVNRSLEITKAGQLGSLVLSIDCSWGGGKTFFLERFKRQLELDGHWVIYVDAWKSDHADDPLLALVSELTQFITDRASPKAKLKKGAKKAATGLLQATGSLVGAAASRTAARYVGYGFEEIGELFTDALFEEDDLEGVVEEDDLEGVVEKDEDQAALNKKLEKKIEELGRKAASEMLSSFRVAENSINSFKKSLADLVSAIEAEPNVKPPLFVLMDELDRCRPTYAIKMLERVKHLFDVSGVVFVVATDQEQLCHSISAVYGSEFDGARYLHRFFTQTYHFAETPLSKFVEYQLDRNLIDRERLSFPQFTSAEEFLAVSSLQFDLGLRGLERCIHALRNIMMVWPAGDVKVPLPFLFPLIAAHYAKLQKLHDALLVGDSSDGSIIPKTADANVQIHYKMHGRDSNGKRRTTNGSPALLAMSYSQMAEKPLHEAVDIDASDEWSEWCRNSFREEVMLLHNNEVQYDPPQYSRIKTVGRLVRSALRMGEPPS